MNVARHPGPGPVRNAVMAIAAVLVVCSSVRGAYVPIHDSLYFFYQRTIYLENLTVDGSWWANPALLSGIERTTALTANTGPLGGSVTMASVRVLFPVSGGFVAGIGATGAGDDQDRSFNATGDDAEYKAHFLFSRPSFETGLAATFPYAGSIGLVQSIGSEVVRHRSGESDFFLVWGNGLGWISPELAGMSVSVAGLSVLHSRYQSWWDHNMKLGFRLRIPQRALDAAVEYAFIPGAGFMLFEKNPEAPIYYEALKVNLSTTVRQIVGLLAGFSVDTDLPRRNGMMFHGGAELKQADVYPYFGGYELGLGYHQGLTVLHRLWLGYRFGGAQKEE